MKIDYKKLIISILIPLGLGALVGFLSGSGNSYNSLVQPSFAPPSWVFPVVWSILYILMGISDYLVKSDLNTNSSLKIYKYQLAANLLWSFVFFTFKWYLFAFIWIILIIVLVIRMMKEFVSINKTSAYLQIPYLLWLIFAAVLNFSIYLLN